jgi:hypothetical protein
MGMEWHRRRSDRRANKRGRYTPLAVASQLTGVLSCSPFFFLRHKTVLHHNLSVLFLFTSYV